MNLVEHHCKAQAAQPPFLLMALAAVVALLLLCVLCLLCRRKGTDETKVAPKNGDTPYSAVAPDDGTPTWTLKGMEHPKGQSSKFTDPNALAGQLGCTSTWRMTPGLPLTFVTPSGETFTVFALKKPLQLSYGARQPIKVSKQRDGHGRELGIEVGWALQGIGYKDVTQMPYEVADKLLHDRVGELPGAIPLTFKRNNGEVKTTYAYQRPLGLAFNQKLPIKITEEKAGHGQDIGIKIGWELLAVNYIDVQGMKDFDEVSAILKEQVDALPSQ